MRYSQNFIERVRSEYNVSFIVQRRVKLTKKGKEYSGLCPFHNEKTPSFTVNDQKGFYHCFGCGAHGDVVKFIMDTERLKYIEAIEYIANMAGISLPKPEYDKKKEDKISILYEIMEKATKIFQDNLNVSAASYARDYLVKRKIDNLVEEFRIGYATNDNKLKDLLLKDYKESDLLRAGVIAKNDKGETYSRFRNRVIFPITDTRSKVIAFGGRVIGEGLPKYLNSPETEIFHKGRILYNENRAKKFSYDSGSLIICEGYMDVIALARVGINNVVAPLGTAFTESHLQRLWNISNEPIMCFDGDNAGKKAMYRSAEIALKKLKPGYSLNFVQLPTSQDPDDVVNNQGVRFFYDLIEKRTSLSELIYNKEVESVDPKTPERRSLLEVNLDNIVKSIEDKTVSKYYSNFFKSKLWNIKKQDNVLKQNRQIPNIDIHSKEGVEFLILAFVQSNQNLLEDDVFCEEFTNIEFSGKIHNDIREDILTDNVKKYNLLEQAKKLLPITNQEKCWSYLLKRYHLNSLECEYKNALQESTEDSFNKAMFLKKEIDKILHHINILESSS